MKIIDQFTRLLVRLGYRKTSVQMLPSCVVDFLKYTSKTIQEITSKDILSYKTHLEQRPKKTGHGGLSESYIHHHIYGLKLFFAWQQSRGVLLINPMSSLAKTDIINSANQAIIWSSRCEREGDIKFVLWMWLKAFGR